MTKEKWLSIYCEKIEAYNKSLGDDRISPQIWEKDKAALLVFVKAMDEATEVYNLENKVKQ